MLFEHFYYIQNSTIMKNKTKVSANGQHSLKEETLIDKSTLIKSFNFNSIVQYVQKSRDI